MWARSKTQVKIWLKWKSVSKSCKMRSKFWETNLQKKIELSLTSSIKSRKRSTSVTLFVLSWTRKISCTSKRNQSLARKSMKVTNSTLSSTLFKRRWMTSSTNMRWLARAETIWVSSLSIEMTSCVSTTKSATFRRTAWRRENKLFVRKKRRSEWSTSSSRRDSASLK